MNPVLAHLWRYIVSCRCIADGLKKLPAVFYRTVTGAEPVRDWLKGLNAEDRRVVGGDIARAEFGLTVGMPLCRSRGSGLCHIVLLHGFEKKTQATPHSDLEMARKRQKEIER